MAEEKNDNLDPSMDDQTDQQAENFAAEESKPMSLQDIINQQKQKQQEQEREKQQQQEQEQAEDQSAEKETPHLATEVATEANETPLKVPQFAKPTGKLKNIPMGKWLAISNAAILLLLVLGFTGIIPLGKSAPARSPNIFVTKLTNTETDPANQENQPEVIIEEPEIQGSWIEAEKAFQNEMWSEALRRYRHLLNSSERMNPEEMVFREFFSARLAEVLIKLGRENEGWGIMGKLAGSGSPIIRFFVNHRLAIWQHRQERYLVARMHLYRCLADIKAIDFEQGNDIEAECKYFIARTLTEMSRSFHQNDEIIPWATLTFFDPFKGKNKSGLERLLMNGFNRGAQSIMVEEKLEITKRPNSGRRWTVHCHSLSLEHLLHQFSNKVGGADVHWMNRAATIKKRKINFELNNVTAHELNEIACGVLGLISRFTLDEVQIFDPLAPNKMRERQDILTKEAISAWRRFFLLFPEDPRVAEGHYSLAMLKHINNDLDGALREYQLVNQRFFNTPVAPLSLLKCAKVKIEIGNFNQAREDLLNILDTYPENPMTSKVYLYLGEVSFKEGLYEDAVNIFRKLYHLKLSRESQIQACLGAGQCLTMMGRHTEASHWLEQYIRVCQMTEGREVTQAYLMLGKSEYKQENLRSALEALSKGLASRGDADQNIDLRIELMRVYIEGKRYVNALSCWKKITKQYLDKISQPQLCQGAILASRAYIEIGLAQQGESQLVQLMNGDKITDKSQKARLGVALGRCLVATRDFSGARKLLTRYWPEMPAGLEQWEVGLELAQLCLDREKPTQAIAVAKELQTPVCPVDIRNKAREILASAYVMDHDYNQAASVFNSQGGQIK